MFVANWLSAHCVDRSADAHRRSRNYIDVTVRHFFSLVVSKSEYRRNRTVRVDPFAVQVPGFFNYLREERGLRPTSIDQYRHHLRRFERYFEDVGFELAALSLTVVTGFITTAAQQFGPTSMTNLAGALRVFLRHLYREGLLQRDISKQVGAPQHYWLADIPRSISWDSVQKMLDQVDRRTVVGRRDYAILLLMITYGLRAREVAR